jgi:dTDP-4-amino-4,6-dideoxygalactose transaminase
MASMLANIGPGDEVILPSYTFTSAATAVTKFGATPVFVDIEIDSKGIDVDQVREAISPRTKAISWVNYAGVAPDIEGLQILAKEFNLLLIEDNAHGLGGTYKGKPLGSFGDFATQSFHATKNIQCGEGGALVVNNPKYIERAEIIREKGTNRSKFMRGEVQKYQWVDQGSSYLLAEVLAAQLLGQLENFIQIQDNRLQTWNSYKENVRSIDASISTMDYPEKSNSRNVAHMFYIEVSEESAPKVHKYFFDTHQLSLNFHYQSLSESVAGKKFSKINSSNLKNTIQTSNALLRLPIWYGMDNKILNCVFSILEELPQVIKSNNS